MGRRRRTSKPVNVNRTATPAAGPENIPMPTGAEKTGTREWSEHSLNIYDGCRHNCRYCYARYDAVVRFKRKQSMTDWGRMVLREGEVAAERTTLEGLIMFPTTHDILPDTIEPCLTVLRNVLVANNQVLIVTKPHTDCVTRIITELADFRSQVIFRFTIGCLEDNLRAFWEPGAPTIEERFNCLELAFNAGWRTSVSAEPMLDPFDVDRLVQRCLPLVTDTIWLGLMNQVDRRVHLEAVEALKATKAEYSKTVAEIDALVEAEAGDAKTNAACRKLDALCDRIETLTPLAENQQAQVERLRRGQATGVILEIYQRWRTEPKIRWKDSIRKLLGADFQSEGIS